MDEDGHVLIEMGMYEGSEIGNYIGLYLTIQYR